MYLYMPNAININKIMSCACKKLLVHCKILVQMHAIYVLSLQLVSNGCKTQLMHANCVLCLQNIIDVCKRLSIHVNCISRMQNIANACCKLAKCYLCLQIMVWVCRISLMYTKYSQVFQILQIHMKLFSEHVKYCGYRQNVTDMCKYHLYMQTVVAIYASHIPSLQNITDVCKMC